MDDLDDFYASLGTDTLVSAGESSESISGVALEKSPTNQIEEDFFDLLDAGAGTTGGAAADVAPGVAGLNTSVATDEDFLSWLDDTAVSMPVSDNASEAALACDVTSSQDEVTVKDSSGDLLGANTLAPAPAAESVVDSSSGVESGAGPSPSPGATARFGELVHPSSGSIIDDIFGSDSGGSSVTPMSSSAVGAGGPAARGGIVASPCMGAEQYAEELEAAVHSTFPEVAQLRQLVQRGGYVPHDQRAAVWALLLTGNCVPDEEAKDFSASSEAVAQQAQLRSDCTALLALSDQPLGAADAERAAEAMRSIIVLYCQRKSARYSSVMSKVLAPLVVAPFSTSAAAGSSDAVLPPIPKPLVSASFYAVAQSFLPLVGMSNEVAAELAADTLHFWLRLLLTYHSPILVQHLDRVIPGWERPAADMSLKKVVQDAKSFSANADLDELEKEMGLGGLSVDSAPSTAASATSAAGSDDAAATWRASSGVINSASPSRGTASALESTNGCISTHFITGIFAGSLPLSQSALLLDWAILNKERFAGLYFVASLLEICSPSLLTLNGASIRRWFDDIAAGCASEWFKLCNASDGNYFAVLACSTDVEMSGFDTSMQKMKAVDSWDDFIRGWIQATAALINTTPKAFREAVNNLEAWAVDSTERSRARMAAILAAEEQDEQAIQQQLDGGNVEGEDIQDDIFGDNGGDIFGGSRFTADMLGGAAVNHDDDDEEEKYVTADMLYETIPQRMNVAPSPNKNTGNKNVGNDKEGETISFGSRGNIMSQLRRLSTQLHSYDNSAAGSSSASGSGAVTPSGGSVAVTAADRAWVHDSKDGNTLCVWSDVAEVVPCLCPGSRRPATTPMNIIEVFKKFSCGASGRVSASTSAAAEAGVGSSNDLLGLDDTLTKASALVRETQGRPLLLDAELALNKPFYFGIDCRSAEDKTLGVFPKTYAMDPATLTDSDELSRILDVLRPIASSVHLCLIGTGEEYEKWKVAKRLEQQRSSSIFGIASSGSGSGVDLSNLSTEDFAEVSRAVSEQHARLNAVAMFFLKQSFKHLSVLEGGFAGAARYLLRQDTALNLQSLVDVSNRPALENLLGIVGAPLPPQAQAGLLSRVGYAIQQRRGGGSGSGTNSANNSTHNSNSGNGSTTGLAGLLRGGSSNGRSRSGSGSGSGHGGGSGHGAVAGGTSSSSGSVSNSSGGSNTSSSINSSGGSTAKPPAAGSVPTGPTSSAAATAGVYAGVATEKLRGVSSAVGGYLSSWTSGGGGAAGSATGSGTGAGTGTAAGDGAAAPTKQVLAGWGRSLGALGSSSLETLKKAATAASAAAAAAQQQHQQHQQQSAASVAQQQKQQPRPSVAAESAASGERKTHSSFVIDDDEEEDSQTGTGNRRTTADSVRDTTAVNVKRTEAEKKRVLAQHRLAGLEKGNTLRITKEELPGAVLFPAVKDKRVEGQEEPTKVHRFLAVTKERFMVLDSRGGGVGSEAVVKSNHHLSELTQLKFKKQDPELVTLFFETISGEKAKLYRVGKRKELVEVLQKNVKQFK